MLVGDSGEGQLRWLWCVEDDAALNFGIKVIAAIRRADFSAELISTGSPRKRFDKAVKAKPSVALSRQHNGAPLPSGQRTQT